jgi:hypothetical protein
MGGTPSAKKKTAYAASLRSYCLVRSGRPSPCLYPSRSNAGRNRKDDLAICGLGLHFHPLCLGVLFRDVEADIDFRRELFEGGVFIAE